MKFPAWYGIGVGLLILLQWAFFLITGSVPEIQTAPWSIGFHIAAEMTMALALIAGGVGTLKFKSWGNKAILIALGMAIYSEINSPGYFAEQGTWALVGMFAILLAGALISLWMLTTQSMNQVAVNLLKPKEHI